MFDSLISNAPNVLSYRIAAICTGTSILLGLVIAICYYITGKGMKSRAFCISLVLIPALVQTVIMLVNGNLGTGVAIVGAFSLIRFRSIPGNSRDISTIFFAMVVGLATGMGYITYAIFITLMVAIVMVVLYFLPIGPDEDKEQTLRVTIYENLDYTTVFDDLFEEYLKKCEVESVKTTNMGSMYQITYIIEQKDRKREKEFLDELRCRNGNLTIICGRVQPQVEQL